MKPPVRLTLLAALAVTLTLGARAQTPALASDHPAYFPGEDIRFTFAGGPGNKLDWIGIYPEGVEPGSQPSTRWFYVDNTTAGNQGLREGTVTFPGGLNLGGSWTAFLLLNDGYTKLAQTTFTVVDPFTTLLRTDRRTYTTGDPIAITFTNGFANPKDWIGIYRAGQTPGAGPTSTLWAYVDGTQDGNTGLADGTVTFTTGLTNADDYVAYFLLNDGYDVLASEAFTVVAPAATTPRLVSLQPAPDSTDQHPAALFVATIANGTTKVDTSSVVLTLNGAVVAHQFELQNDVVTIRYAPPALLAPESANTYRLAFADTSTPPLTFTHDAAFTVTAYRDIVLPAPLHFENFDTTPEDSLPAGWTQVSYTDVQNPDPDLGNLDSASFAKWLVIDAARFQGSFVTYSNPDNPDGWETDYQRVLSVNPLNIVDGQVYDRPLASGRFAFGNSGYRNGIGQVVHLFTPDFNLAGKSDIHLSFHSLWEQNQDSIAAIEYSTDQGQSWRPVAYYLDRTDLITITNEVSGEVSLDAVATFNEPRADAARYLDPVTQEEKGGTYGTFIAAPITPDLAPFVEGRIDDDIVGSKRIELYRLPGADNQATVRFRFTHAGADSWYFGIDDFGLYSIPAVTTPPTLSIARNGNQVTLSWPADATGFVLQSSPTLLPSAWTPVTGVSGNTHTVTATGAQTWYRLAR